MNTADLGATGPRTDGPDLGSADAVRAFAAGVDPMGDVALKDDPYPAYDRMREVCPVARNETHGGFWMLMAYEHVFEVMRDTARFSSRQLMVPDVVEPAGPRIPLQLDGPEHQAYRKMLLPLFTPDRAAAMGPQIRETAARLLGEMQDQADGVEFITGFAVPLPFEIMLRWLGVPEDGWPMILDAENSGIRLHASTPEGRERSVALKRAVNEYFAQVLAERRETGPTGEDAISHIVSAEVDGRELTMSEMQRILMLLFAAGLHSTTSTLGNMMVHLAQHPDDRDLLVERPDLIPSAVEELMRYDSIATMTRVATEDTVVGGQRIAAGEALQCVLGAANRDRSFFDRADEVVFDRKPNRHVSFGVGPHRCIGSHIARAELVISLEEIHRMIPTYRAAPDRPIVRHGGADRGTDELWLVTDQ